MTAQIGLFEQPAPTPRRALARVVTESDGQRLTGQCAKILDLLQRHPQTNRSLSEISLKYTSRISDLRAAGHVIKCDRMVDGVTRYTLVDRKTA